MLFLPVETCSRLSWSGTSDRNVYFYAGFQLVHDHVYASQLTYTQYYRYSTVQQPGYSCGIGAKVGCAYLGQLPGFPVLYHYSSIVAYFAADLLLCQAAGCKQQHYLPNNTGTLLNESIPSTSLVRPRRYTDHRPCSLIHFSFYYSLPPLR